VRRSISGAVLLASLLAASGAARADDVEDGRAAIDARQYDKAMRLLLPKAQEGNAVAQNAVGAIHRFGLGVKQDYARALEWFRKAAAQGNLRAQSNLGDMYTQGQGVAVDFAEAVKWFRAAAEKGFAPAQVSMGAIYANGAGVPQDWGEAMKWYRLAADQGDALAQARVGLMYAEGQGTPKDYAKAEPWFRKSSEQKNPVGQAWLGLLYLNGWGVKKDVAEATKWFRLSADQEMPDAQFYLGRLYAEGKDGTPDAVDAIMWLRRAATYGYADAQKLLKQRFNLEPDQGPLLAHPQQAMQAPAGALAKAYLNVGFAARFLEPASVGQFRSTLQTRLDGKSDTITASNAALYLAGYRDRLRVYGIAIGYRGYKSIAGTYRAAATPSCSRIQSLWATGVQERHMGNLQVTQEGYSASLDHRLQLKGKEESLGMAGIVVESALAFKDPANSDLVFLGEIAPERITVRPDADAILAAWPSFIPAPSRQDLSECVVTLSPARG